MTSTALPHDLSTTSEDTPAKPEPLTDDEILHRHGATIWAALQAFTLDPRYYTEMCEQAMMIEHRRAAWYAKRDGRPLPESPLKWAKGRRTNEKP